MVGSPVSTISGSGRSRVLPRLAFAISTGFTLGVTVYMASVMFVDHTREQNKEQRELRGIELKQTILYLDEVLTMSARMAASTGEPEWEERYNSFVPKLDRAIEEALSIFPEIYQGAAAQLTNEANDKLIEMETRSFELVRAGKLEAARSLLFGSKYEDQKWIYGLGMTRFADIKRRTPRLMELRGIIMHLDEVLTMSARMAAVTGDDRWEERYSRFEPQLDSAIGEAVELVPDLLRGDTADKTDEANQALLAMESWAFDRVRTGKLEEAQQMLFGDEYERQKAIYKLGMVDLGLHLRMAASAELNANHRQVLLKLGLAAALLPILFASWLMLWRTFRTRELGLQDEALLRLNALEAVGNAIVITDAAGKIEWVNPSFTDLTGYSAGEIAGQKPSLLSSGRHPPEFFEQMWQTLLRGETYRGEVINRRKDGSEYPARILIAPVTGSDSQITNFVSVMEDDSVRSAFEDGLIAAKESAESSNRAKSEFLANISHEIRTPVNGILGLTQIVLDGDLSEEQRQHAGDIASCGETLLVLINDLLDLSKLDDGAMSIECVPTDLRAVVTDVCTTLGPLADERGNRVRVDYPRDENQYALADGNRIKQLLLNLVGNAVKFTRSGKIDIVLRWHRESDTDSILHVEINDTGVGIPANRIDCIFDRFVQAEGSTSRKFGGSGLGLAICRELVELMSGSIGVERLDVGTSFFFDLPLRLCEAPVEVDQAVPLDGDLPSLVELRILVAEDNRVNQTITRRMLENLGCQVIMVENGREAAEHVLHGEIDLVLMDCMMPDVDGYQGTRMIREAEAAAEGLQTHVPIIALTARAMEGDREACLEAGMDDYLSKPLKTRVLEQMLRAWVPKIQAARVAADEPA